MLKKGDLCYYVPPEWYCKTSAQKLYGVIAIVKSGIETGQLDFGIHGVHKNILFVEVDIDGTLGACPVAWLQKIEPTADEDFYSAEENDPFAYQSIYYNDRPLNHKTSWDELKDQNGELIWQPKTENSR